jgi:mRNA-degrading endonuclease RelE of RelBE toxin-antitoxin system
MNQKPDLEQIIKKIEENPAIGQEQKGDLKGIYIYQFKMNDKKYLLSYRIKQSTIEIITFGQREKYFRTIDTAGAPDPKKMEAS